MPRIMTDFLDDAVKTHPNKAAFTEEARSLTYKELQEEAYRIAMSSFFKNRSLYQ